MTLVRRLIDLELPTLFRYPGMKAELKAYIDSGMVEAIREQRLRGLIIHMQALQLSRIDDRRLKEIMLERLAPRDLPQAALPDQPPPPVRSKARSKQRRTPGFTPTRRMALLLYGFFGIVLVLVLTQQPGYWQTPTGQAIVVTTLIGSIGLFLLLMARQQARNVLEMGGMLALTLLVIGMVFVAVRVEVIDLRALETQVRENPQSASGYALLGVSLLIGVLLLALRRVFSTLLTVLLLVLLILLVALALRSGVVDFPSMWAELSL